jgi:hypothetical protein
VHPGRFHQPAVSILSAFVQATPPNSLRDLWRTSGESNRFCPHLTGPVRPWPGELAKAKDVLRGPGALLSAVGQRRGVFIEAASPVLDHVKAVLSGMPFLSHDNANEVPQRVGWQPAGGGVQQTAAASCLFGIQGLICRRGR